MPSIQSDLGESGKGNAQHFGLIYKCNVNRNITQYIRVLRTAAQLLVPQVINIFGDAIDTNILFYILFLLQKFSSKMKVLFFFAIFLTLGSVQALSENLTENGK